MGTYRGKLMAKARGTITYTSVNAMYTITMKKTLKGVVNS